LDGLVGMLDSILLRGDLLRLLTDFASALSDSGLQNLRLGFQSLPTSARLLLFVPYDDAPRAHDRECEHQAVECVRDAVPVPRRQYRKGIRSFLAHLPFEAARPDAKPVESWSEPAVVDVPLFAPLAPVLVGAFQEELILGSLLVSEQGSGEFE